MQSTIPDLLFSRVRERPEQVAFVYRQDGRWTETRWREGIGEIASIAAVLDRLGVRKGTPVALICETRPEWTACDLATLCLGGIMVGVYPSVLADQVAWQLGHSGAEIAIVENAAQAAKLASVRDQLPKLRQVVSIDAVPGLDRLADVRPPGDPQWLEARAREVAPEDVATYVFTSGTTGNPKAAVLTHRNFVFVAQATRHIARVDPGDRAVIFLPLAHMLQRFTIYRGLLEDATGWYAESIEALPATLEVAKPHLLASVPRMLEKIRDRAYATAAQKGGVAERIFLWAMAVGRERALAIEADPAGRRPLPPRLRLKVRIADRLVFSKIRAKMGGSLRTLFCGGAALDPEVARFYLGLGVRVLEGWGLTETSAPATVNTEHDFALGTVGKALPGLEVRVADDGELLVRGEGVFTGYLGDPDATAQAFTGDRWFKTGDIGEIDARGFVRITDRKKEILVTAAGKNIPPVNIEKRLERSRYVAQAVALGDAKPYVAALLVPDVDALAGFAKQRGLPEEPLEARLARPEVRELFDAAVADANRELAKFESVKRYEVLATVFSVDSGELTPTLKLKRRVIAQRHADAIARLYA